MFLQENWGFTERVGGMRKTQGCYLRVQQYLPQIGTECFGHRDLSSLAAQQEDVSLCQFPFSVPSHWNTELKKRWELTPGSLQCALEEDPKETVPFPCLNKHMRRCTQLFEGMWTTLKLVHPIPAWPASCIPPANVTPLPAQCGCQGGWWCLLAVSCRSFAGLFFLMYFQCWSHDLHYSANPWCSGTPPSKDLDLSVGLTTKKSL